MEKFDETMQKRIGKSIAELRVFIKGTLEDKERATQQALSALQSRVTALEMEQKSLGAEISKVSGAMAEKLQRTWDGKQRKCTQPCATATTR